MNLHMLLSFNPDVFLDSIAFLGGIILSSSSFFSFLTYMPLSWRRKWNIITLKKKDYSVTGVPFSKYGLWTIQPRDILLPAHLLQLSLLTMFSDILSDFFM